MMIYAAVVTLVAVSSVSFLLSLDDVLTRQQAERHITNTASVAIERMLFEIRQATGINAGLSTLNSSSSVLAIDQDTDTLVFSVATGTLYVSENGVSLGALTPPDVSIEEFYVYGYDNGRTDLVRVRARVSAVVASSTVENWIEGAAILRGSYE